MTFRLNLLEILNRFIYQCFDVLHFLFILIVASNIEDFYFVIRNLKKFLSKPISRFHFLNKNVLIIKRSVYQHLKRPTVRESRDNQG